MAAYKEIVLSTGEAIRLTEKEMLFCQYYLGDAERNATKALIKAGYSDRNARNVATQNLSKLHIKKYIHELSAPLLEKLNITRERVLKEYAGIAFARLSDFMNEDYTMKSLAEIPEDKQAAMSSVDLDEEYDPETGKTRKRVKFKLHDKIKALDKLYDVLHPEDQGTKDKNNVYVQLNQYFDGK